LAAPLRAAASIAQDAACCFASHAASPVPRRAARNVIGELACPFGALLQVRSHPSASDATDDERRIRDGSGAVDPVCYT